MSGTSRLSTIVKTFVSLSLCLSLSVFAVAHAVTKPGQTLAVVAKADQEKQTGEKADASTLLDACAERGSFAMSETGEGEGAVAEDTDEGVVYDDDSIEDASDDEGEDMIGDDGSDDQGVDDHGKNDDSVNDDEGDDGGS